MTHNIAYDIIGYIASAVVLSSFLMTSNVKLRIVNSIGGSLSMMYSLLIHAYPTAICNICILCINSYYLLRIMRNHKNNYSIVTCTLNDGIYKSFIERYADDIATYYPGFNAQDKSQNFARFILSRNEIVGLQVGRLSGNAVNITLDYSVPEYRDCSVGRYAYAHISRKGIKRAVFAGYEPKSADYLQKLGFTRCNGKLALCLN